MRQRHARFLLATTLALVATAGCVSRNVESISADEAAAMPAPPAPLGAGERPSSVASIRGIDASISVSPDVRVPSGVLFLIVRVAGREGGPPLAVKRLSGELPGDFTITEESSMIPGTPFVGDLDIIARLDQDGDAFSRQPGDLEGRGGPVQVGGVVEIMMREAVVEDVAGGR